MAKTKSSVAVVVAKLFLPVTLLLVASVTYVVVSRQMEAERKRDRAEATALLASVTDRHMEIRNTLAHTENDTTARVSSATIPLDNPAFKMEMDPIAATERLNDSMVLISRIENFTDELLNTTFVTGAELRNAGKLLDHAVALAPRKNELLRKHKTLTDAINAGAVLDIAPELIDSASVADEIAFRAKTAFPFYRDLLSSLSEDARILESRIRRGANAMDQLRRTAPQLSAWETRVAEAAMRLSDANFLMTETWHQVRQLQGIESKLLHSIATPQDVELTALQAERLIGDAAGICHALQQTILKELPRPGRCAAEIEIARDAILTAPQLVERSTLAVFSVSDFSKVCEQYFAAAEPPFPEDAPALREYRQLLTLNRVLAAENSTLCNLLATTQVTEIRTLPPRLQYLIRSLEAFESDRALALQRFDFIKGLTDSVMAGERPVTTLPKGLTLFDPEKRTATLAITLYDAMTMVRITDAVVRLEEMPDHLPRQESVQGRYDFRIENHGKYTVKVSHRDYENQTLTLNIDPSKQTAYTQTLTLKRPAVKKPEPNPFLAPGTDVEARVKIDIQTLAPILRKYRDNAEVTEQLQRLRDERIQRIRSGLEPGAIVLPLGVTP